MPDKNGNKATIREVRNQFDKFDDEKISPMATILTRIETKLDIHLKSDSEYKINNDDEHKGFISRRLFITISVILGIVVTTSQILQYYLG